MSSWRTWNARPAAKRSLWRGSSPRTAIHVRPVALKSCHVSALRVGVSVWSSGRVTPALREKPEATASCAGRARSARAPSARIPSITRSSGVRFGSIVNRLVSAVFVLSTLRVRSL